MEQVIILPYVKDVLNDLVKILYNKEYFGFNESAIDYVDTIIDFINTIPTLKYKPTRNTRYGAFYCKYKHNSKTSWYVSFDIEGDLYNIKNITNNHSADYSRFIRDEK
jgi:hypothetical protein